MKVTEDFLQKTRKLKTPFEVYDLDEIRGNYEEICRSFKNVDFHYAMKCNPHPRITEYLNSLGSGFEVASLAETRQLVKQGVSPDRIVCMHPIKSPEFLKYLRKQNILVMAVDSYEEVDKIARYAPGAKLVVRLSVDNEGSNWHLNGKFGLEVTEFPHIFQYIASKGLVPYGLMFHVGSQCENEANWIKALRNCKIIWEEARASGIELKFLSIGGGLPVYYRKAVPTIAHIGNLVSQEISKDFTCPSVKIIMEVGRALVAHSAVLVTTVFGLAQRDSTHWAYIETGTYNGLVEAIETTNRQFYALEAHNQSSQKMTYTIGGPSCVTLDTPFEQVELPELHLGDRLYILAAGAYTLTCAGPFNGFPIPRVHFYQDL